MRRILLYPLRKDCFNMEFVTKVIKQVEEKYVKQNQKKEENHILSEISDVCKKLRCTDRWFNMEADQDLIEACIYQREELLARYRYLMRVAKEADTYSSSL